MKLCHTLPRDNGVRFAVAVLVFAFMVNLIVIGFAGRSDAWHLGNVELKGSRVALAYWDRLEFVDPRRGNNCSRTNRVPGECTDYLYFTHAAGGLEVALAVTAFVTFFTFTCCIVRMETTASMFGMMFMFSMLPAALSIATVSLMSAGAMKKAESLVTLAYPAFLSSDVTHNRTRIFDLAIADAAFYVLVMVVLFVRWVMVGCTHKKRKDELFSQGDVEGVVQVRTVNDDAKRQLEMFSRHVEVVRADFAHRRDESPEPIPTQN
jgi:hypothetical protein